MPLPATGESLYAVAKGSSLTYLQKRCDMRPAIPPGDMEKLKEPAFLRYLKSETRGKPITPDDEDFDLTVSAHTEAEQEHPVQAGTGAEDVATVQRMEGEAEIIPLPRHAD